MGPSVHAVSRSAASLDGLAEADVLVIDDGADQDVVVLAFSGENSGKSGAAPTLTEGKLTPHSRVKP